MVNYIAYTWDIFAKSSPYNYLKFSIVSGGEEKNLRYFDLILYKGYSGEEGKVLIEEMSLSQLVELRDFLNGIKFTDKEEIKGK